jgi:hypothetical protein
MVSLYVVDFECAPNSDEVQAQSSLAMAGFPDALVAAPGNYNMQKNVINGFMYPYDPNTLTSDTLPRWVQPGPCDGKYHGRAKRKVNEPQKS